MYCAVLIETSSSSASTTATTNVHLYRKSQNQHAVDTKQVKTPV